ncbi:DUF4304 domain-containing protein [Flavihumibacter cheonanensis]|uniref:DUF4304 domain-containing protein n=1 Tax=Flavihumibacter cheonanensis TaxID=1442385 RepID=UPI001EF78524|nr:DUF4304 domain-containing protein [Flavihumibacter cheonanensis]MCG7754319.1 DUF4304 domain-containing protein [Flavihumibacter cheonanensis]
MTSKDYRKIISDNLSAVLKERQFKKRGPVFSYSNGDLTYFIGIQSSRSSTADVLKVTVNTEITSSLILKLNDTSLPIENQRHYTRRIGSYLNDQQDKWWIVDSQQSAEITARDIIAIIKDKVLPNFEALGTTNDLARLWKNGGYIGITEGQRKHFLTLLEKASD